jgi:hypothetical protein
MSGAVGNPAMHCSVPTADSSSSRLTERTRDESKVVGPT